MSYYFGMCQFNLCLFSFRGSTNINEFLAPARITLLYHPLSHGEFPLWVLKDSPELLLI